MRHRFLRAGALVVVAAVVAACNGLSVDQRGVYTSAATQTMTGTVEVTGNDSLTSLTVNGVDATVDGESWTADVPLDGTDIFNAVVVEATYGSGSVIRERRTVVYGDGGTAEVLPAGAELPDAVGLRLDDRSFDKIGPVVKTLTAIDTAAIAPPGTVFLDECITQVIWCTLYATASTSAAPTIDDFDVAIDSEDGSANAVVTLSGLHVVVAVAADVLGIPTSCDLEVDADTVAIDGNYTLQPDAADPTLLDVDLVGATPTVTLGNVSDDFVGGFCSIPVIEQIVGLFLPDVKDLMQDNLTTLLGDPDGTGPLDSPVADAIEDALAEITIAGDIGTALGIGLESRIAAADVDAEGIALRASAAFSSLGVAPGAPELDGSVGFPGEVLGDLPGTSPGGLPYDVAVGASATGFNQLLAAETERGLLNVDVTQLGGEPLSLRSLFDLVGAGDVVTEDIPIVIELRPEVAPIVTTAAGPDGATGELRFHGYRATVRTVGPDGGVLLELVLDFRTGVGLELTGSGLGFTFAQPADEDLAATVTQNGLGLPESIVDAVFVQLSPQVFGAVQDTLPSFPLPQFAGLDLSLVEIGRVGSGFVLFADLVPAA
jgi:hypothetical protein